MTTVQGAIRRVHALAAGAVLAPMLKREAAENRELNERPIEYRYALDRLVQAEAHTVLDVGTGTTAWPALLANSGYRVTAVDRVDSYWTGTFLNRHWDVIRQDIVTPIVNGPFDAITCLSVLEHIDDHRTAMRAMFRLLKPGGQLILTGPWNETTYVENAYQMPDAGYGQNAGFICRIYSNDQLIQWQTDNEAKLLNKELYRVFTGPLWTQGERLRPPVLASTDTLHHLICLTLRAPEQGG